MVTVLKTDCIDIANMSTLNFHTPCRCFPASSNESAFGLTSKGGRGRQFLEGISTHGSEIRAVALLCETSDNTQCTTPTRTVTDRECCPGSADLMRRRLGLVHRNLDARGRVLNVDCLRNLIASVFH